MKKYSYLILLILTALGCSKKIEVVSVPITDLQNVKKVTEISIWDCDRHDNGNPIGKVLWKKTSDHNSIEKIMSVIKDINATPGVMGIPFNLICLKDENGKLHCTSIQFESDKLIYGSDYVDRTGRLYDALDTAGFVPKESP